MRAVVLLSSLREIYFVSLEMGVSLQCILRIQPWYYLANAGDNMDLHCDCS